MTAPQLSASNANTEFYQERLPNGLQIVGQRMPDLESVSVCFFARTGARDHVTSGTLVTTFFVSTALYTANTKLDRDRDGVACETH